MNANALKIQNSFHNNFEIMLLNVKQTFMKITITTTAITIKYLIFHKKTKENVS